MTGAQLLDLNFQGTPGVISAYVLDTSDGLAVVDPGPTSTLAALEAGLARLGAALGDVRHLLLTHIHFDHAGVSGDLVRRVPQIQVYVHERGAPHLVSPERLYASATQIYGDAMDRLWGGMHPLPAERLRALSGGETLRLGSLDVEVLAAPGHAVHHVAYHAGGSLFLGDVGGVRLEAAQTPRAPTPPPDIDLEVWRQSVGRLRAVPAEWLHLAHFGRYPNGPEHWDGLLSTMERDAARIRAGLEAGQNVEELTRTFTAAQLAELEAEGGPDLLARFDYACPPWMSVQGLTRYWTRRAARGGAGA